MQNQAVSRLASTELGAREERGGTLARIAIAVVVAELQDSIGGRTLLLSLISSCRLFGAINF